MSGFGKCCDCRESHWKRTVVLSQSLGYLWVFFLIEDCVSSIQEGDDEEE